jgi:hypothetical protein
MTTKKDIESNEKLTRVLTSDEDRASAEFENWVERYPPKVTLSKHLRMARKPKRPPKRREISQSAETLADRHEQ